jgi:acylphosphatase
MSESDRREARGYRVYGRVQGVGFRWWTQRTGEEIGVAGHVRNLRGGGVEVHARGSVEELAALEIALEAADSRTPENGFLIEAWDDGG